MEKIITVKFTGNKKVDVEIGKTIVEIHEVE